MIQSHCRNCNQDTEHSHMHDCAHGIPETHMAGTERFVCTSCGHVTHARDPYASDFIFVLDNAGPMVS